MRSRVSDFVRYTGIEGGWTNLAVDHNVLLVSFRKLRDSSFDVLHAALNTHLGGGEVLDKGQYELLIMCVSCRFGDAISHLETAPQKHVSQLQTQSRMEIGSRGYVRTRVKTSAILYHG